MRQEVARVRPDDRPDRAAIGSQESEDERQEIGAGDDRSTSPSVPPGEAGLNGKQFAKAIGVNPSTVTRYRRGEIAIPERISREWEIRGDKWYRRETQQ